ncbi:MAG: apolipoprotein N-acyltransferase [Candidatus Cloacimonetes bacterium]|nr:apolipoprotein N-acyltransferase [Candidatus Cloacimonadota bacterium]
MKEDNFFRQSYFYKSLLSALLLGLSRLPIHLGFLVFFAFIPLFSLFQENLKNKKIIFSALIFSTIYTAVSLHWISLVTIPGFFGMFLLFGLYFSILFLLIGNLWKILPKFRYIIFICFWLSFEYLQNFGEFRFPWFNAGYSLSDYLVLIQPAEIGGVYLISILILILNILIYRLRIDQKRNFLFVSLLLIFWVGFGFFRLRSIPMKETKTDISIVQVSVPQNKKWKSSYLDSTLILYDEYSKLAAQNNSSLIIWPESAIPAYVKRQTRFRNFVSKTARNVQTDIFMGFPHYEIADSTYRFRFKYYNTCTKIDKNGKFHPLYYKNILVPFGERIPFLKVIPILWKLDFGQANWEYGTKQEFYETDGFRYSPLICFEIAFPTLTLQMARQNTDFIVNLTNDAWFYRSAGTYQHAMMTRFRAVETRKQIYRAANTGYSLIVSPTGKFLQKTELFEKKVIHDRLFIYKGNSIFTKYLHFFPLVFVIGAGIMMMIFLRKIMFVKRR